MYIACMLALLASNVISDCMAVLLSCNLYIIFCMPALLASKLYWLVCQRC